MPEDDEGGQMPGGESDLSASRHKQDQRRRINEAEIISLQNAVDSAFRNGIVEEENLTVELLKKPPIPSEVPHARERLVICSIAMAICLIGSAAPATPENIRPALLSIASVITTALVKPFEKN
jgi:hypothetical protein